MYNILNKQVWETPLAGMVVKDGRAYIPECPILSTGQWKGTLIAENNLDEVVKWQEAYGPVHLVQDHIEDVNDFVGLAENFRIVEDPRGFKVIVGDLEIVDDKLIKKLELMKEKGGGFAGISPRIDWENRDEDGNVEGLIAPHVSIVIHPAQGQITGLSEGLEVMADTQPNTCKCPKCGATIEKERGVPCSTQSCPKCGTKMIGVRLEEDEMKKDQMGVGDLEMIKCPKCGTTNPKGSKVCRKCGAKLAEKEPEDEKKKKDEKMAGKIVVPVEMIAEMEQISNNEKADIPALRGFIQRMAESMKKMPEEEEPEDEKKKQAKKKEYPPEEEKYPKTSKQSYAFPARADVTVVAENEYKKELLPQGLFLHPAGVGLLPIGDTFIDRLLENTRKVFDGKDIPVTIGHPKGEILPDKTVGWLGDFSKDKSLFGVVKITNSLVKEAIDETTVRDCSLGLALDYKDEEGKLIGPVITHMALTNLPYFKKLEGFKKLAASDDVHVDELKPVENLGLVDGEALKKIDEIQSQYEDISKKYAEVLQQVVEKRKEGCMDKLTALVDAEVIRPGAKERFSEFIDKTIGMTYDGKKSVAEAAIELLESSLMKQVVDMSSRLSAPTDLGAKQLVTASDFKKYDMAHMIRTGRVEHDPKSGVPFWTEKGRPSVDE